MMLQRSPAPKRRYQWNTESKSGKANGWRDAHGFGAPFGTLGMVRAADTAQIQLVPASGCREHDPRGGCYGRLEAG